MINDEIVNDGNIDLIEQRLHVHAPFSLENLPFQTCQQSAFVDAERHRRVDRGHGCSQVLERTLRHPRNMVPFGESLNRRPRFIVNSWRSGPNKSLITLLFFTKMMPAALDPRIG